MRKIVLFIASSLDGFIARENGGTGWLFSDADYGYKKFFASVDTVLVGRKTYEQALGFGSWPFEGKKCVVLSRKKLRDKRVEFSGDAVSVAKKLKRQKGKNIWLVGGSQIIFALMNAGLVDEIILSIHPIVLGKGIPLFASITRETKFALAGVKRFKSGLAQLHYLKNKPAQKT